MVHVPRARLNPLPAPSLQRAIFLDRDGVLIRDAGLLTRADEMKVLPGVPEALALLANTGYRLFVITNQTVISRGLATQEEVSAFHVALNRTFGGKIDGFYVCPHHPQATLPEYRTVCDCRKPEPGLILQAAREHHVNPSGSWMIGDRPSDIIAGQRAGCSTIWVQTGSHLEPPIESPSMPQTPPTPDAVCPDLLAAARFILTKETTGKNTP